VRHEAGRLAVRSLEQLDAAVTSLVRKNDDALEMFREVVGYAREMRVEKKLADDRWDTVISRLERIETLLTTNGSGGEHD
jgi:hypothetical protein